VSRFLFLSRGTIPEERFARVVLDERTVSQDNGKVPQERLSVLLLVSNEMVRLYKELFGRGPTRARSGWADNNTLICTLEDSLTPAERNMAKLGEHQRLRDVRMFFQHASEHEFTEAVERATGRKVRAFVSGIDTHKDVSSEVFYLEPEAG
jgi:uncharacterized protein YbcI